MIGCITCLPSGAYRSAYHVQDTPKRRGIDSRGVPVGSLRLAGLPPAGSMSVALASLLPEAASNLSTGEVQRGSEVEPGTPERTYRPRAYRGFTIPCRAFVDSVKR